MDHLPLVSDPKNPLVVRYHGFKYEGQTFSDLQHLNNPEREDRPAFLQAWFFFGLIREVLNLPVKQADFVLVGVPGNDQTVTTCKLRWYLNEWKISLEDAKSDTSGLLLQDHCDRITRCLAESHKKWKAIPNFDRIVGVEVELSIHLLACALEHAVSCVLGIKETRLPWRREESNYLYQRMEANGFCPSFVRRMWNPCRLTWLYYISLLGPPNYQSRLTHSDCEPVSGPCTAVKKESEKEKSSKHVSSCDRQICRTLDAGQDIPWIEDLVRAQKIPLLEYKDGELHVHKYKKGDQYTAISHVWEDGLGDPDGNTVPECQVKRICDSMSPIPWTNKCLTASLDRDLVWEEDRGVTELSSPKNQDVAGRPLLFWLDTICVPRREESLRQTAARNMRAVYNRANRVLVFDAGWSTINGTLCAEEVLTRVSVSNWCLRFWTLQEAVLAKILWFQFGSQCYRQLSDGHDTRESTFDNEVGFYCEDFNFDWRSLAPHTNYAERVARVWNELKQRKTWKEDDKIGCIGTLLDMEPEKMERIQRGTDYQAQFNQLTLEYEHVPLRLLFLPGPKLLKPPLRWAPASFDGLDSLPTPPGGKVQATPTATGLKVEHRGILTQKVLNKRSKIIAMEIEGEVYLVRENLRRSNPSWATLDFELFPRIGVLLQHYGNKDDKEGEPFEWALGALVSVQSPMKIVGEILNGTEVINCEYLRTVSVLKLGSDFEIQRREQIPLTKEEENEERPEKIVPCMWTPLNQQWLIT